VTSPIFLTGMMASGKSTVGRLLALELGVPFIDLDRRIEILFGCSVDALFADGEAAFRAAETTALESLLAEPGFAARRSVVATGGGVVIDPRNRAAMAAAGLVVHLDVELDDLVGRLEPEDEGRPLLRLPADGRAIDRPGSTMAVRRRLAELLATRRQAYRDGAIRVDGRGPPEFVAARVRSAVAEAEGDRGSEAV
jgi:shikimate kinase